jgi:hypothetical protein
LEFRLRSDDEQPVRFGYLRGYFCEVLGARHSNGNREPQFTSHPAPDRFGDRRWGTEKTFRAGDVCECFVDRNPLNQWREVSDDLHGGVTQPLVFSEVSSDKDELRAEFACPPPRHPAKNAEGLCLVRCGKDDPATYGDGLPAQGGIKQLLDRCIEGVQVGVEDCRGALQDTRPQALVQLSLAEHNENNCATVNRFEARTEIMRDLVHLRLLQRATGLSEKMAAMDAFLLLGGVLPARVVSAVGGSRRRATAFPTDAG